MGPEEFQDQKKNQTYGAKKIPAIKATTALITPESDPPPKVYWQAQSLAETLHRLFENDKKRGNINAMRNRFYILARYYGRTMAILRHALSEQKEALLNAALHNLIALHQPIHHMHDISPTSVPIVLTLDKDTRRRLMEDLTIEVLHEATGPLDLTSITQQVNELHLLANVNESIACKHLENLLLSGHVQKIDGLYLRTHRAYSEINLDRASLQALLGSQLYSIFERNGFHSLEDISKRKFAFQKFFDELTGMGHETSDLFAAACRELLGPSFIAPELIHWYVEDLIGSTYPRPYQYESFAIFRGYGYQGQLIEAPTGSGKTMIGMMCIQDWLKSLSPGESILILVPTANYQQQWVGELSYKKTGLKLIPDMIFTGTPAMLESERQQSGFSPVILIMTYTALAQTGSGVGKGGFDQNSIEIFLQGNGLQFVILDEVHKVAENMHSVSADVTRILVEWLKDGSIRGLIGFSGTAAIYRRRFTKLGLQLVYTMPAADLIAYGFVAPFAEFGVPFAYSKREQKIRKLLEEYKTHIRNFIDLVGSTKLRNLYAGIPIEDRLVIGRDMLRIYGGRKDREEALTKRLKNWESGKDIKLNELQLILIIQIAKDFSDEELLENSQTEMSQESQQIRADLFRDILSRIKSVRKEMKALIYFPEIIQRLNTEGFGIRFDTTSIYQLNSQLTTKEIKDRISTTIIGLYDSLKTLYLRIGEGRIDCIKSIIKSERISRAARRVIVFDSGKRIRWKEGTTAPVYSGVAGVFAQLLPQSNLTPIAVLSSEMYLPWKEKNPLSNRIAEFIKQRIMLGELFESLFGLLTQGLEVTNEQLADLRHSFHTILKLYIRELSDVHAPRPKEFEHRVLKLFRKAIKRKALTTSMTKLLDRLNLKYHHLNNWLDTFFNYAITTTYFIQARIGKLQHTNGDFCKFFIVKMPQGERKQLMYDLTARIVDTEDLPFDTVIVSSWARTGWNVIMPDVLIDATATRNVTAWQQLRGRAMRALPTWNADCYRLVMLLLGNIDQRSKEFKNIIPDAAIALDEFHQDNKPIDFLDEKSKAILLEAHEKSYRLSIHGQPDSSNLMDNFYLKIQKGNLSDFTREEKEKLVSELMLARNKVTHIYEMIKAYSTTPQVRYNKVTGEWHRTDSISVKHDHEYSVSPISGSYGQGEQHSPLIYSGDPRKNLPSQLQSKITHILKDRDQLIINGWIAAMTSGMKKNPTIE